MTLRPLTAAALAFVLFFACAGYVAAQQRDRSALSLSEYPLYGDDGQRVPNHTVKIPGPIERLPGVVTAVNPNGKTRLVEFYDLNCPFCRIASVDIGDMVETDADLKLVLVPYPVLGIASIEASRVELAVAKLGTPKQFYAFHQQVYAQRGTTDGARALAIAISLGLDQHALTTVGDSDEVTQTMKNLVALGTSLKLVATPSFIVGGVAILGYPGRHTLQAVVDAVGACGKIVC
ncbi:MAG TPA: DsbA family protein [Xanthobacteraceae bacterium]|nr:DsbA family protein [Xanthobacteraceae bacterium]